MANIDFRAALTKKLGPLQAWQWGAIAGGAVLLWRWYGARQSNQVAYASDPFAQGSQMYSTLSGGGALTPATGPPEFGAAFAGDPSNLYLSVPWGEGYLSLEGSGELVRGVLGDLTALGFPSPSAPSYPGPLPYPDYGSFYQPPTATYPAYAAPQPLVTYQSPTPAPTFNTVQQALFGPTPGYIPTPTEAIQLTNYQAGNVLYYSPPVAGAAGQYVSKPAENFLATQNMNCLRIQTNPEWYTAEQRAACGV